MEALLRLLLFVHLVGFALLLGGAVAQYFSGKLRINAAMLWGAVIQLLSGVGLSAPFENERGYELNSAKIGVKLVIALTIFVMVFFSRKRETVNNGHFLAIVGLTLANAAIAVFWRA